MYDDINKCEMAREQHHRMLYTHSVTIHTSTSDEWSQLSKIYPFFSLTF